MCACHSTISNSVQFLCHVYNFIVVYQICDKFPTRTMAVTVYNIFYMYHTVLSDESIVADDTFDVEEIDDDDDDDDIEVTEVRLPRLPDTQRLAASLVDAAAVAQRYTDVSNNHEEDDDDSIDFVAGNLRNFLHGGHQIPVPLNLNLIKGSDFDHGDEEESESPRPPPPEDSQLTTE